MKRILRAALWTALCMAPRPGGAEEPARDGLAAPLGTAISYQGKLDRNSSPVTGNCNFIFGLFNAATGGVQIGTNVTLSNQPVTLGLFSVALDFGASAFDGQARWLNIQVQGPGDAGYTTLTPRQPITAAPYALHAVNVAAGLTLPYSGSVSNPSQPAFGVANSGSGGGGIRGTCTSGTCDGVYGDANSGSGVRGQSANGWGVFGTSNSASNAGVFGSSASGGGVRGTSTSNVGVFGHSDSYIGVYGESNTWAGVWGKSTSNGGVIGESQTSIGTSGRSVSHIGVYGVSNTNDGVMGISDGNGKSGVVGIANHANGQGGYFVNNAGGNALVAVGRAVVRSLQITGGSDLAEPFDVGAADGALPAPGSVVVIDPQNPGRLMLSDRPYDRRVAGVISGANDLAAGMILESEGDPLASGAHPVAMTGRVWCWADADAGAIQPGDRLTTSSVAGHAMKADDVLAASGAVIGKAMTGLESGRGLVLVLVNLQ